MAAAKRKEVFPKVLNVLLVDDTPTSILIMKKRLEACEYNVTTCTSGVEALAKLRAYPGRFHIVLTDVQNNVMNGFTLLRRICDELDVPVVILSACDDMNSVKQGITDGACGYLVKTPDDYSLRHLWQHAYRRGVAREKQEVKPNAGFHGADTTGTTPAAAASDPLVQQSVGDPCGARTPAGGMGEEKVVLPERKVDDVTAGNADPSVFVPGETPSKPPPVPQPFRKREHCEMFVREVGDETGGGAKRVSKKLEHKIAGITIEQVSNCLLDLHQRQKINGCNKKQSWATPSMCGNLTQSKEVNLHSPPPRDQMRIPHNDVGVGNANVIATDNQLPNLRAIIQPEPNGNNPPRDVNLRANTAPLPSTSLLLPCSVPMPLAPCATYQKFMKQEPSDNFLEYVMCNFGDLQEDVNRISDNGSSI